MQQYKIIEHTINDCEPIYYVKVTHPWFKKLWVYVGKYTDRYYLTTMNDRQVVYDTLEDAYKRIQEHKRFIKRLREMYLGLYDKKRICGYY